MIEWVHAHPFLTFFIVLAIINCLDDMFSYCSQCGGKKDE
jgi:hypothetical protein